MMREHWKCVIGRFAGQFVIITGLIMMPKLCAENLDIHLNVSE